METIYIYLSVFAGMILMLYYFIHQFSNEKIDENEYYVPYNVYGFFDGDEQYFYISAIDDYEAIRYACQIFNMEDYDLLDGYTVNEIPRIEWKNLKYIDEDGNLTTIREFMRNYGIVNNDYSPHLICSTFRE